MKWLCSLALVLCCSFAAAAEEYTTQETVAYTIDVGNGDALLIVGNGNTIYLPADPPPCEPVRAHMLPDGATVVVMPSTELSVGSAVVKWRRVVLLIDAGGTCRVIEAVQ